MTHDIELDAWMLVVWVSAEAVVVVDGPTAVSLGHYGGTSGTTKNVSDHPEDSCVDDVGHSYGCVAGRTVAVPGR